MKKLILLLTIISGLTSPSLAQLRPIPPDHTREENYPATAVQQSRICIPVRLPVPYLSTFEKNLCEYMSGRYNDGDLVISPLPLVYYVDVKYQVWRAAPFDELRLHADTFSLQEKIYFTADGTVFINSLPVPCQCGWDDEPAQAVVIGFDSKISFDSTYNLATKTTRREVNMLYKCLLTAAKKDATENLKHLMERIQDLAKDKVDNIVPRVTSFKAPVQHLWDMLQKPVKINDHTWLTLGLRKFSGGPILVSDGVPQLVSSTLGVTFTPTIQYGSEPVTSTDTLPKLSQEDCQPGFEVHPEISISLIQLDSMLNLPTLSKNEFIHGRRKLSISEVKVYNSGQHIVIEAQGKLRATRPGNTRHPFWSSIVYFFENIFYRKTATLYFTGTPGVNSTNDALEFKDLSYEPATRGVLERKAAWIIETDIINDLKKRTDYNVSSNLDEIKSSINTGLNISTDNFRLLVTDIFVVPDKVFIYKDRIYARFNMAIDMNGKYFAGN